MNTYELIEKGKTVLAGETKFNSYKNFRKFLRKETSAKNLCVPQRAGCVAVLKDEKGVEILRFPYSTDIV